MTEPLDRLAPGAVVAGDYLVTSIECADAPERCFLATDRENNRRVRVAELPSATAGAWAAAAIEHPAVVELLAVLSVLGSSFCVFAEVTGATVAEELGRVGRLSAKQAVGVTLRVAEALTVLHRAGVVHGAVGPAAVVLESAESGKPLLCYTAPLLRPTGYRAPDRRGLAAAREDDLWATGALLYQMLTGEPPPEAGLVGPEQVAALDVADELLIGVMVQALAADPNRRSVRIASVRHPLSVWLARRASQRQATPLPSSKPQVFAWSRARLSWPPGDQRGGVSDGAEAPASERESGRGALRESSEFDSSPAIEISTPPPPIVADEASPARPVSREPEVPAPAPESAASTPRRMRARWVVGGAALVALGAIAVARLRAHADGARRVARSAPATLRSAPRPQVTRSSAAHPLPAALASASRHARASTLSIGSCIVAHSLPDSFAHTPNLDWVCSTTDPRQGALQMRAALLVNAPKHAKTRAMRLWAAMTWYGMAAFAALRGACCTSAAPIELPHPGVGCAPLADALNDLSRRAARHKNLDPPLAAFDRGIFCELGHRREHVFWQQGRLDDGERSVLNQLLAPVMHPSAPAP